MEFEKQYIKCSKFQDTETVIKKAEDKIEETRSIKERQYYAQDILLEAKALISCSNYNSKTEDSLNCHLVLLKYIQEYKNLAKDEDKVKNPSLYSAAFKPAPLKGADKLWPLEYSAIRNLEALASSGLH